MQPNTNFTKGMLKYAGIWSSMATKGYDAASKGAKSLLTKVDPATNTRRFSGKKIALTGAGLYAGSKVIGEQKKQQSNLSRDYMSDIYPYRQSDTLRVAR